MRTVRFFLLLACLSSSAASAADSQHGKTLHDANCIACHVSLTGGDPHGLYTRNNRRIDSLSSLQTQVQRCELAQGLQWFPDDIESVAQFLDQRFYKFE